jgi:hypothetical protein
MLHGRVIAGDDGPVRDLSDDSVEPRRPINGQLTDLMEPSYLNKMSPF